MNQKAIYELMELFLTFETYTYNTNNHEFYIKEVSMKQFTLLYDIILRYNLKFKIDNGIRIWLD